MDGFLSEAARGKNGAAACLIAGALEAFFPLAADPFQAVGTASATWPWEAETRVGSYSIGARYYSSTLGRFLTPDWSEDPEPVPYADLSDPQSLNLYAYVGNNPVTDTDADGHICCAMLNFGSLQLAEAQAEGAYVDNVDQSFMTSTTALPTVAGAAAGWAGGLSEWMAGITTTSVTVVMAFGAVAVLALSENGSDPATLTRNRESGGGKNAQKANPDRVDAAQQKLDELRAELDQARQKPNKTPADKEIEQRIQRAINKQIDRMRDSENHSQSGKGGL